MKIKINISKFKIDTNIISQKEINRIIEKEASNTLARIDRNLVQGKDVNGHSLESYSESYAKRILQNKIKGKGSLTVNLTQSGKLRRSRQVKSQPLGASIEFIGGHSKSISASDLAAIQLDMRPGWHELSDKDKDKIQESLRKYIITKLNKLVS
jgi:hypothetical protein